MIYSNKFVVLLPIYTYSVVYLYMMTVLKYNPNVLMSFIFPYVRGVCVK